MLLKHPQNLTSNCAYEPDANGSKENTIKPLFAPYSLSKIRLGL